MATPRQPDGPTRFEQRHGNSRKEVLQPCDEGVIRSTRPSALCRPASRPWVIAAASLGSGMAFLDSTVLNVALPAVQADLGASAREVQWSLRSIRPGALRAPARRGYPGRPLREAASSSSSARRSSAPPRVWCALAPGTGQLVAARAVQGVGGALLVPASLAIVGASFEGKQKAKAIGAWAALSGTGDGGRTGPGRMARRGGLLAGRVPDGPRDGRRGDPHRAIARAGEP